MQNTTPTVPATREHLDVYGAFLTRVLALAARYEGTRRALGKYAVEELHRQTGLLEAAKRDGGAEFDIRREAGRFIQDIGHNFRWIRDKHKELQTEFEKDFERIKAVPQSSRHTSWMTDWGKHLVQRALDFGSVTNGAAAMMPLRARAMQAAVINAYEVLNLAPSPEALRFALETVWLSYENYYMDYRVLVKQHAAAFNETAKKVFEMLQTIDERIAARDAAEAARAAEEDATQRRAQLSTDDDEEDGGPAHRAVAHQPVQSDTHDWDWDRDDRFGNTWDSGYNPANGLPMTSPYGVDVLGNAYGTDGFGY